MRNEKAQDEKTKYLCGIVLRIRATQNVTESDHCTGELVTSAVKMRKMRIWEAEAMLLEKPVSRDQESHPVIFAQ